MTAESLHQLSTWVAKLPKAELHLHIDGSLQAHRLLSLAKKNRIVLPYTSIEDIQAAYHYKDLQSFLDLYYLGASVLIEEDDFYHLMMDYLLKCKEQNVVHTEIMVEPQTYAPNGVSFETMMNGFQRAIDEAIKGWGQSVLLILSFLRHTSEAECLSLLADAEQFKNSFVAIGLASAEKGNPPKKFERLFEAALAQGYKATAHAGEEGPVQYIWDSLNNLNVERIDHGVRCVDDELLLQYLVDHQIPLTVCPLSNIKLHVFNSMHQHNVLQLLEKGVNVTINSDDPAYFGGYLNENFEALFQALNLNKPQAIQLIENGFNASFLSESCRQAYIDLLPLYS